VNTIVLVLLSLLALTFGAVVGRRAGGALRAAVDGFVVAAIGSLVVFHVFPHLVGALGPWALLVVALGALGGWLHKRGDAGGTRTPAFGVAMTATAFAHAVVDGVALVGHGSESVSALGIGVVLHRVPVGVAIATVLHERVGKRAALATAAALAIGTVVGSFGAHAVSESAGTFLLIVQALFVGVLLAASMSSTTGCPAPGSSGPTRAAHVTGFLVGFGTTLVVAMVGGEWATLKVFVELAAESAWPILFAFAVVGVAQAMSQDTLTPLAGKGSLVRRAVIGTAVGLPTPLCSCSVLPMYTTARRRNISAPAAMAFLVAAPEIGVPAIVLSASMLGGPLTIARTVGAAVIAIVVGVLVGRLAEGKAAATSSPLPSEQASPHVPRFNEILRGALDAADHTVPWIVVGLVLAATCTGLVSALMLRGLPPGVDVVAATVVGLPLYVCASGSTPLATSLLAQGVSPGAVIAFLWAGPATNVTTVGLLTRLHGARVAGAFAVTIGLCAIVLGLAINALGIGANVATHAADAPLSPLDLAGLVGLVALAVVSLWRQGAQGALAQLSLSVEGDCPIHGTDCRGYTGSLKSATMMTAPVDTLTLRLSTRPRRGLAPPTGTTKAS